MNGQFRKPDCIFLILCIFFSLFIIGAVGKRGQELNKRMICVSNIRQLTSGLMNYADDHDGVLPSGGSGNWPWDTSTTTIRTVMQSMGMTVPASGSLPVQDVFYCPSNYTQEMNRTTYWSWGSFRIIGYVFLWKAGWNSNGQHQILGTGNKRWVTTINIDNPGETDLIVDALCSQKRNYDPAIFPNGNFGLITVGGTMSDMSNHQKTAAEPYGGNVGFVDGHVQWRPFEQMQLRFTTPNYGGEPHWWW